MALCPFARKKLIRPGSNDPRIRPRAIVLHVAVSKIASLFSFFRHSSGIESHFYVTWTGKLEQYRDTGWQADANYLANDFAISIETAGWTRGRWNKRQVATLHRLILWLHKTHNIPLRKIQHWNGSGVGYHTQFGAPGPWTPVSKSCPGPDRIRQFNREFVPWMKRGGKVDWFDMASMKDLEQAIRNTRITIKTGDKDKSEEWRLEAVLAHLEQEQDATQRLIKRVLAGQLSADKLAARIVAKLGGSADATVVKEAVKDGIRELIEE